MSKQKGQGLLEFALILPLLLLMFFGIIEFGRIFQAYLTVQHAAREAARYAVTGQGGATMDQRVPAIKETAVESTAGLRVDYSKIDWRECTPGVGFYSSCMRDSPPDSGCDDGMGTEWEFETEPNALLVQVYTQKEGLCENNAGGPGERVLVRVVYNLESLTPFFSGLFPRIVLQGQMEMINEGFGPTGASHGGVLPPTLEPLPVMVSYDSETLFTDSDGVEVNQYVLGVDLIYVTVTDKDENLYLQSEDTVTVIVRDRDDPMGDSVSLTLTEIGPNAGVFRNTIGLPSTSGSPNPANNDLEIGPGHWIIAEYEDNDDPDDTSDDEARMTGAGASGTYFTNSGGTLEVTEYVIGVDGIYVTVEDSDEAGTGTVTITVTATSGDIEALTLTETGPDTGIFRNTGAPLSSDTSSVSTYDGTTLQVQHCDTITANYTDDDDPLDRSSATATMYVKSEGSVAFDRDTYSIYVDTIFVEVQDLDESEDCLALDQVTVIITSSRGDEEELTLDETGPSTGVFRNTAPLFTAPNDMAGPYSGFLEAQNGDVITVTYTDDDDGGDTRTDTATMFAPSTSSATSFTDSGGTDVSVYNIGVDDIYVTVQDGDENVNSSQIDTVSVTVTDGDTTDSEMLTLSETGANTGVFRNTTALPSITGTVSIGDNVLQTQPGNTIRADYADGLDTSFDTASMGTESTTRFTDSGGLDAIQYALGVDGIYVTVQDADENTNPSQADTIEVSVSDSETNDGEVLTLTETGDDTGVFRNTTGLSSTSSAGSVGDGTLNTAAGNTITAVYVDQDDEADTTSDTATMIVRTPSTTSFTNDLGVEQGEYYLGTQLIYVTVEDADENLSPSVTEVVTVTVSDGQTGDSETLTLYETGVNTGVFRGGALASNQDLVGNLGNNLLETQPDNTITASYTDDDHGTDISSDTATMRASDQPPDLVVTDINVEEANPVVGVPVSVTVTVRNQNEGSVTSTLFDVDFYIYTDLSSQPVAGRPGDAKQWYSENVPGGTQITLVYSIAFPQEGTLYLYAQVDTSGRVAEADETNNIYLLTDPYETVVVGCNVLFNDNMESGVGDWTTREIEDVSPDTAEFARVEHGIGYYSSATHAWWVDDPAGGLETYLISPQITVPSGMANVQLRFWHRMRAEQVGPFTPDGGWLEYNIDSGAWNDVTAGMIDSGGYNGQVSSNCPSPSHEAWTGAISWQEVVVNIPMTTGEHTIQFRWHFEGDRAWGEVSTPPRRGWWIDDVMVGNCQEPPPVLPPGSPDCVTAFQDNFGGDLSQWSVSDTQYVYISSSTPPPPSSVPGRLRLRTQSGPTREEYARTAQNIDLSGYSWATLSYPWWTNALDSGEWGQLRASDDGGSTWATVATYYGTNSGSESILLGDYVNLTSNFRIEFRVLSDRWQSDNYERFEVDNVVLEACNTEPIPPQDPNTGNIIGTTRYYDLIFGQYFYISGVDVWATCTDCVPSQDAVYTYSLEDYSYGFWNLPVGTYDIYAESIINNDRYNDLISGVQVQDGITTTQLILLERVY